MPLETRLSRFSGVLRGSARVLVEGPARALSGTPSAAVSTTCCVFQQPAHCARGRAALSARARQTTKTSSGGSNATPRRAPWPRRARGTARGWRDRRWTAGECGASRLMSLMRDPTSAALTSRGNRVGVHQKQGRQRTTSARRNINSSSDTKCSDVKTR